MALHVALVSPEDVLYEGEADMVIARTREEGDIAFQPGHAQFLGALSIWPVELILADGARQVFAVHGGFVEVSHDRVTILSDVAELSDYIDVERAQRGALPRFVRAVDDVHPGGAQRQRQVGERSES